MTHRTDLSSTAEPGQHLEGAWMVNVFPAGRDESSPVVEVAAFIPGGILVNVAPDGTASAGEWIRVGDRQFAVTFVVLFLRDGQPFRRKIRSTMSLSETGDEFSGPFHADVFDPHGNFVSSYSGTIQATRMHVELLE